MDRKAQRAIRLRQFNPNGVGLRNGRFIGLPFHEEEAEVVVQSVPWDVTVSYGGGAALGPGMILDASGQLDLEDPIVPEAWTLGVFVRSPDDALLERSTVLREKAEFHIGTLEVGMKTDRSIAILEEVNEACAQLHEEVYQDSLQIIRNGQIPGLVGGDHSTPFGLIRALNETYPQMGILQIDAHMDLRRAYEGFAWSHASIFYNVMNRLDIQQLVQVGIRDYCQEEWQNALSDPDRIKVYRDRDIRQAQFDGASLSSIWQEVVDHLPSEVYISFDIDGLDPSLCPGTGTPVPGGLSFAEANALLEQIVSSGRQIIGFDLCEVAGDPDWDGNVGARLVYRLATLAGYSQNRF
ncbi:MAG: agmatinase family protein [Saprospiraceae bacterium]|nr:agmatinase family protein [Saprospiraceae bacterium]